MGSSGGLNHEAHKGQERRIEGGEGDGDSVAPAGAGVLLDVNPQSTLWAPVCRCSAPVAAILIFTGGRAAIFKGASAIVIVLGLLAFVGVLCWIFFEAWRGKPRDRRETLKEYLRSRLRSGSAAARRTAG